MNDLVWNIFWLIISLGCLVNTIKISIYAINKTNNLTNKISKIIFSLWWFAPLIVFIPWYMGGIARFEINPIPWLEFHSKLSQHGFLNALLSVIILLTVELWFFWTPSQLFISYLPHDKKVNTFFIRLTNILLGIILTSHMNFFYKLILIDN